MLPPELFEMVCRHLDISEVTSHPSYEHYNQCIEPWHRYGCESKRGEPFRSLEYRDRYIQPITERHVADIKTLKKDLIGLVQYYLREHSWSPRFTKMLQSAAFSGSEKMFKTLLRAAPPDVIYTSGCIVVKVICAQRSTQLLRCVLAHAPHNTEHTLMGTSCAFLKACNPWSEMIPTLFEHCRYRAEDFLRRPYILKELCARGCSKAIIYLQWKTDLTADDFIVNGGFESACENGRLHIVEMLMNTAVFYYDIILKGCAAAFANMQWEVVSFISKRK